MALNTMEPILPTTDLHEKQGTEEHVKWRKCNQQSPGCGKPTGSGLPCSSSPYTGTPSFYLPGQTISCSEAGTTLFIFNLQSLTGAQLTGSRKKYLLAWLADEANDASGTGVWFGLDNNKIKLSEVTQQENESRISSTLGARRRLSHRLDLPF